MLIYHSCAVTSHKYRGMFSLLELKIDFKRRASVWPSVANCIFRTYIRVPEHFADLSDPTNIKKTKVAKHPNISELMREVKEI